MRPFILAVLSLPTILFSQIESKSPLPKDSLAGPQYYHIHSQFRQVISLSGEWEFKEKDREKSEASIPSSMIFTDEVEFQRTLPADIGSSGLSFMIVANGIQYDAEIYVNDVFIGKHLGGSAPFTIQIPDELIRGAKENILKIVVDNTLNYRNTIPLRKQVGNVRNYGGIFRDLYLVGTRRTWLDEVTIRSHYDHRQQVGTVFLSSVVARRPEAEIRTDTVNYNRAKENTYKILTQIVDRNNNVVVSEALSEAFVLMENRETQLEQQINLRLPKTWSPEDPELYTVVVSIVTEKFSRFGRMIATETVDEVRFTTGFTSIGIERGGFLVNGLRFTLKGINYVEFSPESGATLSHEKMARDISLLKLMGVNAVRFMFNPPHPYYLELCSQFGLFALVDLPLRDVPSGILNDDGLQSAARSLYVGMVKRDMHQPSLFARGMIVGFDAREGAGEFLSELRTLIRSFDDRLVYAGARSIEQLANPGFSDFSAFLVPATPQKDFSSLLQKAINASKDNPLVILEYGRVVENDNRNGSSDPYSYESQAKYFLSAYNAIKKANLSGSFPLAFSDWRGDRPSIVMGNDDPYIYRYGVMNLNREKRLAYDVLRSLYKEERVAQIPVGNSRPSFPFPQLLTGLIVILMMGYQYNYNRRFNESIRRAIFHPYNFFADVRDLRTVSLFQTTILGLLISFTIAMLGVAVLAHFKEKPAFDFLLTLLVPWDTAKDVLIMMAWDQISGLGILAGVVFGLILAGSLLIRSFALFLWSRITFYHSFIVIVWAFLPMVILSIIGMIMFKLLEVPAYSYGVLVAVILFFLWGIIRFLTGIAILFERNYVKIFVIGCLLLTGVFGGLIFYYSYTHSIGPYMSYFFHTMGW